MSEEKIKIDGIPIEDYGRPSGRTTYYENYNIKNGNSYYPVNYIQQGWQCPICKKVLAPFITYCHFCSEDIKWTCTSTTKGE